MKTRYRFCLLLLAVVIILPIGTMVPLDTAKAAELSEIKGDCVASEELCSSTHLYEDHITINGTILRPEDIDKALEDAFLVKDRFAAVAAPVVFVPGLGQVVLLAGGAVVVAGVTYYAGSWVAQKVAVWYREHRKNARKSTRDKHTKPRPGRAKEKKRQKSHWKRRK